ncbi:MAG: hypothetical protein OCC49_00700 [Fibrobacterales bacterium]
MKRHLKIIILFSLLFSTISFSNPMDYYIPSLEFGFNHEDILLGGELKGLSRSLKLSFGPMFTVRPYEKKVLVTVDQNSYYQFRELRYTIGLNAEKYFFFDKNILALMAGAAYSGSHYSGTAKKGETGFIPVIKVGYIRSHFGVYYRYMKAEHVTNHHITLNVFISNSIYNLIQGIDNE